MDIKKIYLKADESLKLLFSCDRPALIKFVNNVFTTNYPLDSRVEFLKTEFIDPESFSRIHADIVFSIGEDEFHFEFQTRYEEVMVIRMFNYGANRAREKAETFFQREEPVEFVFPRPFIIVIDECEGLGDTLTAKLRVSGTEHTLLFPISLIKMWEYSVSDLKDKQLYLLLPYALLRYRHKLAADRKNRGKYIDEAYQSFDELLEVVRSLELENIITKSLGLHLKRVLASLAQYLNQDIKNYGFERRIDMLVKHDIINVWDQELEEARLKGEEEGKEEGKEELVLNMLKRNASDDFILDVAQLSKERLQELKARLAM